jgi:DNA-binding NtrC family response regulator
MSQNILVVTNDGAELPAMMDALTAAGFRVSSAASFQEAKQQLAAKPPDLMIADERLGAFNGLHLILSARADHPKMAAIITTGFDDPSLAAEAARFNVHYLVKRRDRSQPVSALAKSLDAAGVAQALATNAI